jgi:preprotein translocase subunit SecB
MGKSNVSREQENKAVQFEIERLYIKQQSTQTPNAPNIFQLQMDNKETKPETQVEMKIDSRELGEHRFEVTLGFHITLKIQQQTALRCEVQQTGIFRISECTAEQRQFLLEGYCPGILHPYARKVVADLSWNAGFLPITLPPIDFEQARKQREQNAQNTSQPTRIEAETVQ